MATFLLGAGVAFAVTAVADESPKVTARPDSLFQARLAAGGWRLAVKLPAGSGPLRVVAYAG
ncbi:hypothetical protein G3I19_01005 [Streptomyces sp. SID10853]|uniref:hypothetical protein n=1 Tax=Streptomyces sp. SID10853 TaxID=2706028 RepID=UPI0013BEF5BB|nr:hypothetical protein [Streptomyces sp. SID10853]NDZ77122.1 hypothetical protein [Streptomyces sp. SID10853]